MPDEKGNQKADATETPLHAYKDGREESIEEGSLGHATGGADEQKSRLPEAAGEDGSFQSGGFTGQEADDSPDSETHDPPTGQGDPAPQGTPDQLKRDEGSGGDPLRDVGPGAKDPAPMERGTHGADEVGERGVGSKAGGVGGGQEPEPNPSAAKSPHPVTPGE